MFLPRRQVNLAHVFQDKTHRFSQVMINQAEVLMKRKQTLLIKDILPEATLMISYGTVLESTSCI